jgi:hypothetical protein
VIVRFGKHAVDKCRGPWFQRELDSQQEQRRQRRDGHAVGRDSHHERVEQLHAHRPDSVSATAAYQGRNARGVNINSDNTCQDGTDNVSEIGFGTIPDGRVADACEWGGKGVIGEADILMNKHDPKILDDRRVHDMQRQQPRVQRRQHHHARARA